MSRRRARAGRESRFRIDGRAVGLPDMLAAGAELGSSVDDAGRLLHLNDPELGFGERTTRVDPVTGDLLVGRDPVPVLLCEPERSMLFAGPDRRAREIQVEAAVAAGLHRIGPGIPVIPPGTGWSLHRLLDGRLELRSPNGDPYSRVCVAPDPAWISSALHHGVVVVLYGPQLGVRTPPGLVTSAYSPQARRAEIRLGRRRGVVAGAVVRFHNNR